MSYGIPYYGSKSRISEWVVAQLPSADTFVDLFAGGCAITHAAMLSGKYKSFIANDLMSGPNIFKDAIDGKFSDMEGGITREQFFASDDNVIKLLYSFGNDMHSYLWSHKVEPVKASAERMLSAPTLHERRIEYRKFILELETYLKNTRGHMPDRLQQLEGLERLERLQKLQGLQGLDVVKDLKISNEDYRDIDIPYNSVVYADPPYRGTGQEAYPSFYSDEFDAWLGTVDFPVYVSEFECPSGCTEIAHKNRMCSLPAKSSPTVCEKLFIQTRYASGV